MNNGIPSFADLSPTQGENLDEKLAAEHFFGKSASEAESLFRENAIYYAGDLMWMGDKAFAFYLPAFSRFLESSHADGDADALNSLASVVGFRLEHEPQSITGARDAILTALNYCADNYSKFKVEAAIYGDLRSKLLQLHKAVAALNPPVSRQTM
jgi:hypothetical protein